MTAGCHAFQVYTRRATGSPAAHLAPLLADRGEPLLAQTPTLWAVLHRHAVQLARLEAPVSLRRTPHVASPRVVAEVARRWLVSVHRVRDALVAPTALALVEERCPHAE